MPLLLPRSCFVHIIKTGGGSVRSALRQFGDFPESGDPQTTIQRRNHAPPDSLVEHELLLSDGITSRFLFTFLRHPVNWYRSYWAHRMRSEWIIPQYPEEREAWDCMRNGKRGWNDGRLFDVWVEEICERHPGFLSRIYRTYTKRMHFIGRTENLLGDLNSALQLAGEDFQVDSIAQKNLSGNLPVLHPDTKNMILESEHDALVAWQDAGGFIDAPQTTL